MTAEKNVLLLMSGSIACAKATSLISIWRKAGHNVRVASTASVGNFVGRGTLEGLSGQPLLEDAFEAGSVMEHIRAAQWADLVVACPASANLLARFASGIADDLVTTLWQAAWDRKAPLVVVPAMNSHMWRYPATEKNVQTLRQWGVNVLPTARGDLACGETGAGRMLEPTEIQEFLQPLLNQSDPFTGRKILVTGGGTREPIDAVRYIGNHSTGRTAATLTDTLSLLGHEVTWLGGKDAATPRLPCAHDRFCSFSDLAVALRRRLSSEHFDAVIHAAAVSDFSVDENECRGGKISSQDTVSLTLRPNPKLLQQLRHWSKNPALRVVGFKLTVDADSSARQFAVTRQLESGKVDLVVHNDFREIEMGRHVFEIHDRAGPLEQATDATALAHLLHEHLEAHMGAES